MEPSDDGGGASEGRPPVRPWSRRVAVSGLVAVTVFVLSGYVAWWQFVGSAAIGEAFRSVLNMQRLDKAVREYQQRTHRLPSYLSEMPELPVRVDDEGRPLDGWGHPFMYWTNGTHYRITSLGGDGKSGGQGLDSDLSSDEFDLSDRTPWRQARRKVRATFPQFLAHARGHAMLVASAVAGLMAFLLAFLTIGPRVSGPGARGSTVRLAIRLLGIALATLMVAVVMTSLHASGH